MNEKKSQTEISKAKTKPEQMNIHKYVNKHTNKYIYKKISNWKNSLRASPNTVKVK